MAWDDSSITDGPHLRALVGDMAAVWWTSTAPAGSTFQLYRDHLLIYAGPARSVIVPHGGKRAYWWVGVVPAAEISIDWSASLPSPGGDGLRARLAWQGGTFQTYPSRDLSHFDIYGAPSPGAAVDETTAIAQVVAYPSNIIFDGYGMGGYGRGGYGWANSDYHWTSALLTPGTWDYKIKAVDHAGVAGAAISIAATLTGPPLSPARYPTGERMRYTYDSGSGVATLTWNPPPASL